MSLSSSVVLVSWCCGLCGLLAANMSASALLGDALIGNAGALSTMMASFYAPVRVREPPPGPPPVIVDDTILPASRDAGYAWRNNIRLPMIDTMHKSLNDTQRRNLWHNHRCFAQRSFSIPVRIGSLFSFTEFHVKAIEEPLRHMCLWLRSKAPYPP